MPVFACRWTNGDVSFVMAPGREAAIEQLDEIGNAEGCPVTRVPKLQIHLKLTDDGQVQFGELGEATEDFVWKTLYPRLGEAWGLVYDEQAKTGSQSLTEEQQERIRRAVQEERERVRHKEVTEPLTGKGKDIKRMLDMPTSLVNKVVDKGGKERLKSFRPRGKPH